MGRYLIQEQILFNLLKISILFSEVSRKNFRDNCLFSDASRKISAIIVYFPVPAGKTRTILLIVVAVAPSLSVRENVIVIIEKLPK